MDLYEVEGKLLFRRFGIHTEEVNLLNDEKIKEIEYPVVLKGQYLSGKRGKAGAIQVVHDQEEFIEKAKTIREIKLHGSTPAGIHIAPFVKVRKEHYVGFTLDRKNQCFLLLYSDQGGMDIEELAQQGMIESIVVNSGNIDENASRIAEKYGNTQLKDIILKLWKLVNECDCTTAEINPLGELIDGEWIAMDAKVVIDDNAWYRQKDNVQLLFSREAQKNLYEARASQYDLSFVSLHEDGNVGVIAGGAGIGMASVDSLVYYGLKPFNFCDLGGGVTSEKTYHALHMLLEIDNIKAVFINVFGGVNNCLEMAKGICKAYDEMQTDKVIVVKSRGFNQEEGWKLYKERDIAMIKYGTTDDAVKKLRQLMEENI